MTNSNAYFASANDTLNRSRTREVLVDFIMTCQTPKEFFTALPFWVSFSTYTKRTQLFTQQQDLKYTQQQEQQQGTRKTNFLFSYRHTLVARGMDLTAVHSYCGVLQAGEFRGTENTGVTDRTPGSLKAVMGLGQNTQDQHRTLPACKH